MIDLKEFKNIADINMSDIVADNRLKENVLAKCRKKQRVPVGKLLAAAACLVLILGVLNLRGMLQLTKQPETDPNTESFVAEDGFNTLAADAVDNNALASPAKTASWELESLEAAKRVFGDSFLQPSYIPEPYKLEKVYASGDGSRANEILIQYRDGERYLMIIENMAVEAAGFESYESIEINGLKGYRKAGASDSNGSEATVVTEVHWFRDGVHYAVLGQIAAEEAVKIAESMK